VFNFKKIKILVFLMDEEVKKYALLSDATYIMGDKNKTRADKIKEINNLIKDTGFKVHNKKKYSNKNLITFENDKGEINISHKGTQVKSRTGFKDIVADLGVALSVNTNHMGHVKNRRRKTEQIVRELKPETLTLSGHSLGGYTVNQTLANSGKIRKKLKKAYTFNAGSNPILNDDLKVSNKIKDELKDKVEHHRIQGDLVSIGLKRGGLPFGTLKNYKLKEEHKNERGAERILNKIFSFNPAISNVLNLGKKAIDNHHIDHFYQGRLNKIEKKEVQAEQEEKEPTN